MSYADDKGRAMLHFAAAGGFAALCRALVQIEGVDVGQRDAEGLTGIIAIYKYTPYNIQEHIY